MISAQHDDQYKSCCLTTRGLFFSLGKHSQADSWVRCVFEPHYVSHHHIQDIMSFLFPKYPLRTTVRDRQYVREILFWSSTSARTFLLAVLPQGIWDQGSWFTGTTCLGCHYSKTWSFTGIPELPLVTTNADFLRGLLDATTMLATKKKGKARKARKESKLIW